MTDKVETDECDRLRALVKDCAPYLKPGQTPAERMAQDHNDILALMASLAKAKAQIPRERAARKAGFQTGEA